MVNLFVVASLFNLFYIVIDNIYVTIKGDFGRTAKKIEIKDSTQAFTTYISETNIGMRFIFGYTVVFGLDNLNEYKLLYNRLHE